MSHQFPFRWELGAGRQFALHDGSPKMVSDLEIRWPVAGGIEDSLHWEPPGGVLELDETIHDGLVREMREETGLTFEPDYLIGV